MNQIEKALIDEIKKTLGRVADSNPAWRLVLGTETLSATEIIKKLGNDKKFQRFVLTHYVGLAVEIEQKAREKIEGTSG